MAQSSKREQLIQAALELFAKRGYHATGIDAISEKASVTKKTLYHHFRSKEELILAALRNYDERFRNDFMRSVEAKTDSPVGRLLAIFDVLEEWLKDKSFSGCLFVGAMGEYPDEHTPIRHICQESKKLLQSYIRNLIEKAELENSDQLSQQLFLLIEGAITMAQVNSSSFSALQAKAAAEVLIINSSSLIR